MSDLGPNPELEGEDDLLAAEHALGVLDAPERAEAERRELADPAFAQRLERWQGRLGGLLDGVTPTPAPGYLWPRIAEHISTLGNVVELRLRRSVLVWRSASAIAAGVAAVLAFVAFLPRHEGAAPVMTSEIAAAKGPVVYVAMMDPAHHRLILQPVSMTATPGRSPELWLIGASGKPVALGVGEFGRPVALKLDKSPTGAELLAVSIEPEGGSPTGQPTGPVIATGKLQLL